MNKPNSEQEVLKFPCDFPIKIIGNNSRGFLTEITAIIKSHYPNIMDNQIKHASSKNSNFIAITVIVHATGKDELDALYLELTTHPDMKMVL